MPSQTMALHGIPLTGSVSLLVPRPTRGAGGGGGVRRAGDGRSVLATETNARTGTRRGFWVAAGRLLVCAIAVAGGRGAGGGRGARGRGATPVRFIQKGPGEFPRFFAVFSAVFRLGFGSEAGQEGGWTAAIAGDGLPAGRRGGGGGARKREGGGYLSQRGVRAIRKGR